MNNVSSTKRLSSLNKQLCVKIFMIGSSKIAGAWIIYEYVSHGLSITILPGPFAKLY